MKSRDENSLVLLNELHLGCLGMNRCVSSTSLNRKRWLVPGSNAVSRHVDRRKTASHELMVRDSASVSICSIILSCRYRVVFQVPDRLSQRYRFRKYLSRGKVRNNS